MDLCIVEENYQNSGFDNVHEGISGVPFSKNVLRNQKRNFFFCKNVHEEKSAHVFSI